MPRSYSSGSSKIDAYDSGASELQQATVERELLRVHDRVISLRALARLPTGLERTLIQIDNRDPNWQDVYRYVEPVPLPRGTTIRIEFVSDDAARNRRHPDSPAQPVVSGQNRSSEVGDLWLQVLPRTAADRALLNEGARH